MFLNFDFFRDAYFVQIFLFFSGSVALLDLNTVHDLARQDVFVFLSMLFKVEQLGQPNVMHKLLDDEEGYR
jgi:hypothetical protein